MRDGNMPVLYRDSIGHAAEIDIHVLSAAYQMEISADAAVFSQSGCNEAGNVVGCRFQQLAARCCKIDRMRPDARSRSILHDTAVFRSEIQRSVSRLNINASVRKIDIFGGGHRYIPICFDGDCLRILCTSQRNIAHTCHRKAAALHVPQNKEVFRACTGDAGEINAIFCRCIYNGTVVQYTDSGLFRTDRAVRRQIQHMTGIDIALRQAVFHIMHENAAGRLEVRIMACRRGQDVQIAGLADIDILFCGGIQRTGNLRIYIISSRTDASGTACNREIHTGKRTVYQDAGIPLQPDISLGSDAIDHEIRILDTGQIYIALSLYIHFAAVIRDLYRDRLLLPDCNVVRTPFKIPGLRIGQQLQMFHIIQCIIGNRLRLSVNADAAVCRMERDIPCRYIGRFDRQHITGFTVDDAVLDRIQQLIPAPAIVPAVCHFGITGDDRLFVFTEAFVREIVGHFCLICRIGFLDRCLVFAGLGYGIDIFCLRRLHTCIFIERICSGFVAVYTVSLRFCCKSRHPVCQCAYTIRSGICRRLRLAVGAVFTADQAAFQPAIDLVFRRAAALIFPGMGIHEAAVCHSQHRISRAAHNGPEPHIAFRLGQDDIPAGTGIDTGRHAVRAVQLTAAEDRQCLILRTDAAAFADQIDALPLHGIAAGGMGIQNITGRFHIDIPGPRSDRLRAAGRGLTDMQVTAGRDKAHTAVLRYGIYRSASADDFMVHRDIAAGLEMHIIGNDGILPGRLDPAAGAGERNVPLPGDRMAAVNDSGIADRTVQKHIARRGNGNIAGAVPAAEEPDSDGLVRLQAGRRRHLIALCFRPGIDIITIAENLAGNSVIHFFHMGIRGCPGFVRRIIPVDSKHITGATIAACDERAVGKRFCGVPAGDATCLDRTANLSDMSQQCFALVIGQCAPEEEIFLIGFLFDPFSGDAAGPCKLRSRCRRIIGRAVYPSHLCRVVSGVILAIGSVFVFRHQIIPIGVLPVLVRNGDQSGDVIVGDAVHLHIFIYRGGIDMDVCGAVHRHDAAVAGTGNLAADLDLSALGPHAFRQELAGGRIVINLNLIIPDLLLTVPDRAAVIHEILVVPHDFRIGQCSPAGIPVTCDLIHFRLCGFRQRRFIRPVAALDQAADIDIHRIDIDVAACQDSCFFILQKRFRILILIFGNAHFL